MICLGIECTAHTLGIGIVETKGKEKKDGKPAPSGQIAVLANEKDMHIPKNEGIVPRKAADHHAEVFDEVMRRALQKSGCSLEDIGLFSYSMGPGLGPCLRTGAAAAKYLALLHKKPLLGINHCHAHMEVSRGMLNMLDPLVLYVSGGNTQIIIENKKSKGSTSGKNRKYAIGKTNAHAANSNFPRFRVLGETLDIGMGNLFDSFARELGMEHAHGSQVAKLAAAGKKYISLPYTVKGMNFAFSGLFTAAGKQIGKHTQEDLCFSLMETAFAEACEATERALCLTRKKELLVCGGVAQNKRLCEMLGMVAAENGARFGVAAGEFNADNGGMIAYTAACEYARGVRMRMSDCKIDQKWRIDEVR
jgi:tRNA A37 threonylcarbamoyltransferase TsaD